VANAWVKFVDAAGNLVYQTKANGGTVTWNGNDLQGNRVATGTYFILASDDFGSERQVGKVYLVR
jgi:flagellar hook assembly protein FlgD